MNYSERSHCDRMSPINRMFNGRSVFITGASGFIGRVLLEKLLRTYQGIKTIYILLRAKKNLQPNERLRKQLLNAPIFDRIKSLKNGQQLLDKIVVVTGDIGEPNLGICDEDMENLLNDQSLSIVFNVAATVKFDEPLEVAIRYNLASTRMVLDLCKRLSNLISLCHVSTAYVNSDIKDGTPIEEKLYPVKQRPQDVLKLAEAFDPDLLQAIKSSLVGERPNTYTYTKALAEHLIATEGQGLPVAIVRPSIVIAAWKEPIAGWIDNLNGPTGLMVAIGKGLMRSMHAKRSKKADIIPVDVVVNTMISSAYYASRAPPDAKVTSKQPTIFHCTSSETNPITWGRMNEIVMPVARRFPSEQVLRYPYCSFKSSRLHDQVTRFFVHFLPALMLDLLSRMLGKKARLLSIYRRLDAAVQALSHFTTIEYRFQSKNTKLLECCMSEADKSDLYLDIKPLDWTEMGEPYFLGTRRFILKEPDSSLDQARRRLRSAYRTEILFRAILLLLGLACSFPLMRKLAGVWCSVGLDLRTIGETAKSTAIDNHE